MSTTGEKRVTSDGMKGPYGQRYSWAYWAAVIGAGILIVLDIVGVTGHEASYTNVGALILIAAAILLRPGGIHGPNR